MKKIQSLFSVILIASLLAPGGCRPEPAARWANVAGGIDLRDTPSDRGEAIARIPHRAEVRLLEETGETVVFQETTGRWSRVEYQGKTGWVFGGMLSAAAPPAVPVAFVSATSFRPDAQAYRFHPVMAIDGDPETAWCEGGDGSIRDILGITFGEPVTADAVEIAFGPASCRPKAATIWLDDDGKRVEFPNESKPLALKLDSPAAFTRFSFRLDDAFSDGAAYLSEIGFFLDGKPVRIDGPGAAARIRSQSVFSRSFPGRGTTVALAELKDGGCIVATDAADAADNGGNGVDAAVVRIDARGEPVWTRTYSWKGRDAPVSIHETRDGGFILCTAEYMFDENFSGRNFRFTKLDAHGGQLWSKGPGGESGMSAGPCRETGDGNFFFCGSAAAGDGAEEVRLIGYDANGGRIFESALFQDLGVQRPQSVRETADGGFIIGGFSDPCAGGCYRAWVCKTDARGRLLWKKDVPSEARLPKILDVREAPGGGYVGCGYGFTEAGPAVTVLVKLDDQGGVAWSKTLTLQFANTAYRVEIPADGTLVIGGRAIERENTKGESWLAWLDAGGGLVTMRRCPYFDPRLDIDTIRTRDGGFLMAGAEIAPDGEWPQRIRVIKTDEFGTVAPPAQSGK